MRTLSAILSVCSTIQESYLVTCAARCTRCVRYGLAKDVQDSSHSDCNTRREHGSSPGLRVCNQMPESTHMQIPHVFACLHADMSLHDLGSSSHLALESRYETLARHNSFTLPHGGAQFKFCARCMCTQVHRAAQRQYGWLVCTCIYDLRRNWDMLQCTGTAVCILSCSRNTAQGLSFF
jgi:hypothetical protein